MMWDVVDLRGNLNKLEEKHAYVKWWAKRPELDLILEKLDVNFEDIKDALDIKDDLYCIYVGQSKDRAIAGYLSMQFNQKSTFRISLSSIISLRQFDREAVNNFLDKLKIEIFTIDLPVKSEEAKMELTNSVNNCLEKNFYILNIKGNNHPLSSNISKKLSKIRKQAKKNEELYSKSDIKNLKKDNINTSNKIVKEDKNMWFVAAGESSSKIDLFRINNCIAIGWNVGNVKGKSKKDIDKKYALKYPNDNNRQKGQAVSQINNFVNNINIEEYVITSDNVKKQYLLGKCISDYYFSDEIDDDTEDQYEHFRDVEWLCTIDWDDISEDVKKYISSNSVRRINKISNEFLDLIKFIPLFSNSEKRNKIYFGAPGTGKSFTLKENVKTLLGENEENYERVTFHPDYTYANFVGTYKPVPKGKDITYEYVPGPFMRILIKALQNPFEPFLLIIEEINRANVAAVFGDVFQLLDRDHRENISEYPINTSEDLKDYLKNELKNMKIPDKGRCGLRKYWKSLLGPDYDKIKIPSNMFIWATMNSADQGVFPMDTAFKRRWDFKYFSINHNEELIKDTHVIINDKPLKWNDLRKQINDELLSYNINEDKLMGPFFAFNEFKNKEIPIETFKDIFKNKIIMYLFEDAAKSRRKELFKGASNIKDTKNITYSQICELIDNDQIVEIFSDKIKDYFIEDEE